MVEELLDCRGAVLDGRALTFGQRDRDDLVEDGADVRVGG
jgi:hypothetical protein